MGYHGMERSARCGGCGFFHVQNDKIVFQRGWDKLSFLKQHGLPVENSDENPNT